jgi:phosphoribosylaminoimidazolecarboxamide formyltransferase/IMP cyclohydrolase
VTTSDYGSSVPRALLSAYDKTGIVELARGLRDLGWELLSSGGTARALADAGIPVVDVATETGYPAILGHRVVTLHPKVHGGILADPDLAEHRADLDAHGIVPISLVVVNLYPFASDPGTDLIDIGGPALVRAAAKNHRHVAVVTDPGEYAGLLRELRENGEVRAATRREWAVRAFALTARYDAAVAAWMANDGSPVGGSSGAPSDELPAAMTLRLERADVLRYGENPHQRGARYRIVGERSWWDEVEQLGGKEMSYLNVYDADAAWSLVHRFADPAAVVIKHANPCGVAVADDVTTAYRRAHACDPLSAFGGIVAVNRPMTGECARSLVETFTEVVVAPDYAADALVVLREKKNLRILRAPVPGAGAVAMRSIDGAMLVQTPDVVETDTSIWRVVTVAQPTESQLRDAVVAWQTCAAVSSNAIVIAKDLAAVGIGAGQQNRVDAARIACTRAGDGARGAAAASDAFFPFRDGPDALAAAGVVVIVQPGGSQRDDESIAAANEHGISMIFTARRHFRH